MKERLTSAVTWTSTLAIIIPLIAMNSVEMSDKVQVIASAVIAVLGIFGVLNNPTDKRNF